MIKRNIYIFGRDRIMNITNRTVIKKYEYAQVNLITDSSGNRFIEKIEFNNAPVIDLTFKYDNNGLEFIESIIKPLEIPHARIIDSIQNEKCTTYVMDYINGINCADEPKAEYLYIAAEKIGAIYYKSKMNMARIDKGVVRKYTLTKEKIFDYIKVINKYFYLPLMDSLIEYIFDKYQDQTMFVNHHDMQFKNFIYNDDLHIIDWGGHIHPFFSDLQRLMQQADEVDADMAEIKRRYIKFSQISAIKDEDIIIGGIIDGIVAVFGLLAFDCPIEWAEGSYNELQEFIRLLNCH